MISGAPKLTVLIFQSPRLSVNSEKGSNNKK